MNLLTFRHRHRAVAALWASVLAAFALAALSGGALAQEERIIATQGAWTVKCGAPPGAKNEKCWIEQKVTAEDRPQVGLTIIYFQSPDNQTRRLQAVAPLGVMLLNGLGLKIDGNDIGRVPFQRCPPLGCVADAQMDDKLLNLFKRGGEALFIIFDTPEAGIGIPVSLKGFSEALDSLTQAQTQAKAQ